MKSRCDRVGRPYPHTSRILILIPGQLRRSLRGAQCPDRAQIRRSRRFARTALIRAHAIGATIGFAKNRTAIALADHPLPVSATTAAEQSGPRRRGVQ